MVLRQLHEVVGEHCLIEEVLGPLNIIPVLLLDVARLTVSVDPNKEVFALICVHSSRVDGVLQQLERIVD